jgi:hypothetical protein
MSLDNLVPQLIAFIYVHDDKLTSAETLIKYIEEQDDKIHFVNAGVVRLARSVFVFDKTKHHELLVILLAEAQRRGYTYLLLPVQAASSLLVGKPSKDIQGILEKSGVPFCPTLA